MKTQYIIHYALKLSDNDDMKFKVLAESEKEAKCDIAYC
jgi:hypothetical protein